MPSTNGRARPIERRSTISKSHFKFGDVVWVPFPFVEAPRVRERPALVVAHERPSAGIELLWVLMITSAANKGWDGDISLEQRFADCGLAVPCIVRTAKIATVEVRRVRPCGALPDELRDEVRAALAGKLSA